MQKMHIWGWHRIERAWRLREMKIKFVHGKLKKKHIPGGKDCKLSMQCRKVPYFDGKIQRKPKLWFRATFKMPPQRFFSHDKITSINF